MRTRKAARDTLGLFFSSIAKRESIRDPDTASGHPVVNGRFFESLGDEKVEFLKYSASFISPLFLEAGLMLLTLNKSLK